MSLINQMLQDLDSRRAVNGALPNEVRPLPAAPRSHGTLVAGICIAVFALLGVFVWRQLDSPTASAPRAALPAPPQAEKNLESPPGPSAPPAAALPEFSGISGADDEARLRLTTSLRLLPERELLAAAPAVPSRVVAPPTAAATPANAKGGALLATHSPTPNGPVLIEKSAASGSSLERAEGEYRKALGVLNSGRLTETIEGLRAALKLDGAHTGARQLLFKLLVENRRVDEAAELLQEGLQSQPAQILWAMSLGRLQVDHGDLPGAWQTLQRSLPFAVNNADYQGFAGHVLQRLGRNREAAAHYQTAAHLAPAEGRWWLGLGLALESSGQAAEAREALLRAKASATLGVELANLVEQKLRQLP